MALCNKTTAQKEAWKKTQNEIWDLWLDQPKIVERFTDRLGFNAKQAQEMMKEFIQQRIEMPFDQDMILEDALVKRIKYEIKSFNKILKGDFTNLPFIVPEGISKQDPVSRKFYVRLNEILNFERVQVGKSMAANAQITDHMINAYASHHGVKTKYGKKGLDKLFELRRKILDPKADTKTQAEFINEMEKLVGSDKDLETVNQFVELIHMNNKQFKEVRSKNYVDPKTNQLKTYNGDVYQAVKVARNLLNDMGKVYINGLGTLKTLIAYKYANTSNINTARSVSRKADKFMESVDEAIKAIEKGLEEGGYFPHSSMDTIIHVKEKLSKVLLAKSTEKDLVIGEIVDEIASRINPSMIPAHAKSRNKIVETHWNKDPLMVLSEYSNQAAQFNKLVKTQESYFEALKNLSNIAPENQTKFIKGVKQFISEEYTVFTKGTTGRPEMANKMVTTLNALATARTMGFNLTGAIKNAASAVHFYSRVGFKAGSDAYKAYEHDRKEGGFREVVDKAEEEAGFKFTDASQELYSEGLILEKDIGPDKVNFDPVTGRFTVVAPDGTTQQLKSYLKRAGKYTLDKALIFHRATENQQRKWMFRTAFHLKYKSLLSGGMAEGKARVWSQNYALRMVNGWAYEYAAHAKAKLVRGEWRTYEEFENGVIARKSWKGWAGAGSEVAFHLMHYPLSLIESQYSSLKGAGRAIASGQGLNAEEVQYVGRYAGVSALVAIASALLNTNLFNIIENESTERVSRILDDLTEYDNPEKGTFGLMSEFSGPTLGTLKYIGISSEIIDLDHSTLNKILFGNVDYSDETDKRTQLYNAYQYSTEWGVIKNKVWPSLKAGRGRDLFVHYLKAYPSKWTKKAHGMLPWTNDKKRSNRNTSEAIKVLESMRR